MSVMSAAVNGIRPIGRFARWLGPAWIAGLVALVASIPLTLALMGVNFATTFVDRAPIRQHVMEAFADGQLRAEYWKPNDIDSGAHPFNDCLILHLALRDDAGGWERALAPRVNREEENPCMALKALAETPEAALAQRAEGYGRYLHGHTALASVMLSQFSLDKARGLMMLANLVVLGGLLCFAAFRGWRSAARGDSARAATAGFIAVAAVTLLLFFGEQDYGMSLSHFPADMVIYAYLWFALLVDPSRWTLPVNIAVHTAFGVATIWMEFLTGGIPLSACVIAFVFASQAVGANANEQLRRVFIAGAAFVAAIAGAFAFKMFLTAQAIGPEAWSSFASGLSDRVAGAGKTMEAGKTVGLVSAWKEMFWYAANVGAGWRDLGRLLIVASFLSVAYGMFVIVRRKMWGPALMQPGLLIAGFAAIVLWHVGFYPHTSVHAHFMVRTLVGLFFTSGMLMVCLHREQIGRLARSVSAMLAPQGS